MGVVLHSCSAMLSVVVGRIYVSVAVLRQCWECGRGVRALGAGRGGYLSKVSYAEVWVAPLVDVPHSTPPPPKSH